MKFDDYFSDEAIVRALVKQRLKSASAARSKSFIPSLAGVEKPPVRGETYDLMPPRSQWPNPPKKLRLSRNRNAAKVSWLTRFVLKKMEEDSKIPWVQRLSIFVDRVQNEARAWCGNHNVAPDRIKILEKDGGGKRAIAIYSLFNSVLMGCFSTYLRDVIDPVLTDSCLAFRAPGPRSANAIGIDDLCNYRVTHNGQRLWVAEVDIKSFYDSVSHARLLLEIESFAEKHGVEIDSRCKAFIQSFLNGYSVSSSRDGKIGIAQGSALSCVLANLFLAIADEKVLKTTNSVGGQNGLYLRYCDDVILLHPRKENCEAALSAYLETLTDLQLVYHPAVEVRNGKELWSQKSKKPYLWQDPSFADGAIPWIGFIGYQIRYDGKIRIRKKSIEKEQERISEEVCEVEAGIKQAIRCGNTIDRNICRRVEAHLVAHAIGRQSPGMPSAQNNSPCWAKGFSALHGKDADITNLRGLDNTRRKAVSHLRRFISQRAHRTQWKESKASATPCHLKFFGAPYSYHRYFQK